MSTNSSTQATKDSQILAATLINVGISLVLLILFLILRPKMKSVYGASRKYPFYPTSYFSWIPGMFRRSSKHIFEHYGLDVLMLVLVMKYFIVAIGVMSLYGLIILMPVDGTSSAKYLPDSDPHQTSGSNILTIGNILTGESDRYWAHWISVLFNTVVCCVMWIKLWEKFRYYRRQIRLLPNSANYTVRVSRLAADKNAIDVYNYFDKIFPGEIAQVQRIEDANPIVDLKIQRMDYVKKLESAIAEQKTTGKEVKTHKTPPSLMMCAPCFCCTKKVAAIPYYESKIEEIEREITKQQKKVANTFTPFAYITFKHVGAAMVCAHLQYEKANTRYAVCHYNVRWLNHTKKLPLGLSNTAIYWIVSGIILALLVFYGAITAFATTFANLDTLGKYIPPLLLIPLAAKAIIGGLLPTILISVIFIILKMVLYKLMDLAHPESHSKLERNVFRKLFLFYVINVFLVSLVASTFLGIIDQLATFFNTGPLSVLMSFAQVISNQSIYFINYIITIGLIGQVVTLLHPGDIFMRYLYPKYFLSTSREKAQARTPAHYQFGLDMALHCLVFLVTLTYSSIAPLILPFGFVYFCIANLLVVYQSSYIYAQDYDGFGDMFPAIANRIMACIILYQILMMGLFVTKTFWVGVGLTAVIAFFTCIFRHYAIKHYERIDKYGLVEDVLEAPIVSPEYVDHYIHPAMRPADEDLNDINRLGNDPNIEKEFKNLPQDV